MSIVRKVKTLVRKPNVVLVKLIYLLSPLLPDKFYLNLLFYFRVGYRLNFKNPQTFNEKLNWMKLYYRNPLLSSLSDKYTVKEYVRKKIGGEYVVKNYGVWDSFDDIDFATLPDRFVLKTTHDQGGVVVCHDRGAFDVEGARLKLNLHLERNLFWKYREWPYKLIKPQIIAEEFLESDENDLNDYKFFCFDGSVKLMYIATGRNRGEVKFDFFDMDFNPVDLVQAYPRSGDNFKKPENFDDMVQIANKLSKDLPQVRIDLYNIRGKIFFGEFTFFHHGGLQPFHPKSWDYLLGSYINLSQKSEFKGIE